jgi:hypothetical protein
MSSFLRISFVLILGAWVTPSYSQQTNLRGAWQTDTDGGRIVMICSEKYFSAAVYDMASNSFVGTCGGTYRIQDNTFVEVHEFNTLKPEFIGKEIRTPVEIKNDRIVFIENKENREWKKLDDGTPGALAGAWLITGRMENSALNKIAPGARRTMKILSGTRFQWIAYNVDTKEFFGTGGGTYTAADGKYKETIEFFSRDSSRVGKTLEFDFSIEDGNWRHKGLSSKGDPIDEVWTKREKLKL